MNRTLQSMARLTALLTTCVALLFFFQTARAANYTSIANEVSQRVKAATVMVHIEYDAPNERNRVSWGTGFVVGNGLVMTNAHVVTDSTPTRIYVHNDYLPATQARVVTARYDTNHGGDPQSNYFDVALLSFTAPANLQLPILPFAMNISERQEVFAFGYPGADLPPAAPLRGQGAGSPPYAPFSITGGTINEVIPATPRLLMHDALCMTGNSGGPLINARGEVVGMQTWSADPDERNVVISFAIESRGLAAFVQGAGFRPHVAAG